MDKPQVAENFQSLHSYFLANISHEFRTPLSSITASLELLMDADQFMAAEEQRVLLRSVQMSALNLQTLVDNLLESSSIEAGHFVIHRHSMSINQVLCNAINVAQPMLDRREQSLVLTRPFNLPSLFADPVRLTQLFINLLTNASKYSPQGQKIDLGIDILDNRVLIAVADRGPGIPDSEHADIFSHFTRLATTPTDEYGAGLGLSVVKAIVEGHGGEISIDNRPGGGSIFWIVLPIMEGV